MALIDLLLFAAIISVLLLLGAGGYVLMLKRFSFLSRPYPAPASGRRFSKLLGTPRRRGLPDERPQETPGTPAGAPVGKFEGLTASPLTGAAGMTAMEEITGEFPGRELPPATARGEADAPWMEASQAEASQETTGEDAFRAEAPGIPWSYGDCKITALVRDPHWLFVYWEISADRREEIARRCGRQTWEESRPVLRIYDATNLYYFDSRHFEEIAVNDYANNWYIHTGRPDRTFCIELGRVGQGGSYIFLARSNFVSTPRDGISDVVDEEWLLLPEHAAQLYRQVEGDYPGPSS
jgi:hypothetical protein